MSDSPKTSSKLAFLNRKRLAVGGAVLLLLIVLSGIFLLISANKTGSEYSSEVSAWRKNELAKVEAKVKAAKFSDITVSGRTETDAELAAQRQRCKAIEGTNKALTNLYAPELKPNPYGSFSSKYKQAHDLSNEMVTKTANYKNNVSKQLAVIKHYCQSYVEQISLTQQQDAATMELNAATDPQGEVTSYKEDDTTTVTITCNSAGGCTPYALDRRKKYAEAFKKVYVDISAKHLKLFYAEDCPLPDLKKVCEYVEKESPKYTAAQQAYVDMLNNEKISSGSAEYDSVSDNATSAYNAYYDGFNAIYRDDFKVDTSDRAQYNDLHDRLLQKYETQMQVIKF